MAAEEERKPIAFLTTNCLEAFVVYDDLAKPPLAELGWQVRDVSWWDTAVCWDDYQAVIVRSPWDYHHHHQAFLKVIERIETSSAMLLNGANVIRWNIDKSYLRDLQHAGLAIVPTQWIQAPEANDIDQALAAFGVPEVVVKPTIGAGARDTFRINRRSANLTELIALYRDRWAMIQPFLSSILNQGEWSLFYFGDQYSHAVRKVPASGDYRVQEEYGSQLSASEPAADLQQLAERTMRVLKQRFGSLLYARIDLVRLDDGTPALIEVELIEPSLYFPYDSQAPLRFAAAVDHCCRYPVAQRDCEDRSIGDRK